MSRLPRDRMPAWRGSGKRAEEIALVTGGDTDIGRAVAFVLGEEGADIAILTRMSTQVPCSGDARWKPRADWPTPSPATSATPVSCRRAVDRAAETLGAWIDVLGNNAAEQHVCMALAAIEGAQVERTFGTDTLGMMWVTKAALGQMPNGRVIATQLPSSRRRAAGGWWTPARPRVRSRPPRGAWRASFATVARSG